MARINKYRCDQCQTEVNDMNREWNWIHLCGTVLVTGAMQVQANRQDVDMDFCSPRCLKLWVESLVHKIPAQEEPVPEKYVPIVGPGDISAWG